MKIPPSSQNNTTIQLSYCLLTNDMVLCTNPPLLAQTFPSSSSGNSIFINPTCRSGIHSFVPSGWWQGEKTAVSKGGGKSNSSGSAKSDAVPQNNDVYE